MIVGLGSIVTKCGNGFLKALLFMRMLAQADDSHDLGPQFVQGFQSKIPATGTANKNNAITHARTVRVCMMQARRIVDGLDLQYGAGRTFR